MTYDPYGPNRTDQDRYIDNYRDQSGKWGLGVLGLLVLLGIMIWAFSGDRTTTASNTTARIALREARWRRTPARHTSPAAAHRQIAGRAVDSDRAITPGWLQSSAKVTTTMTAGNRPGPRRRSPHTTPTTVSASAKAPWRSSR